MLHLVFFIFDLSAMDYSKKAWNCTEEINTAFFYSKNIFNGFFDGSGTHGS